jgi:hypothetical protein
MRSWNPENDWTPISRNGSGGCMPKGWRKTHVNVTLVRFTARNIKCAIPLTLVIKLLA